MDDYWTTCSNTVLDSGIMQNTKLFLSKFSNSFQFVLTVLGDAAAPDVRSSASQLHRGVSSGRHSFVTDPDNFPVGEDVQKLEGQIQCSGEAQYVDDVKPEPEELAAAYVLTKQACSDIGAIDWSEALVIICPYNRSCVSYFRHERLKEVSDEKPMIDQFKVSFFSFVS